MINLFLRGWTIYCVRRAVVLLLFFPIYSAQAQAWKLAIGSNITQYQFKNSAGKPVDLLKRQSGLHLDIAHEHVLLDTVRLISKFSKSAIYFSQKPKIAKILSLFIYDLGINYNQFNAIGDVQQIAFSYQTDYLGVSAGIGPKISLYKGWSLQVTGRVMGQYLVAGQQLVGSRYFDLLLEPQFKGLRMFSGVQIEVIKQVNAQVGMFAHVASYQTHFSKVTPTGTLDMVPMTLAMGIRLYQ
jgi:hypothetical protein